MKFSRFVLPLLLPASLAVSLGLFDPPASAQDMPPLPAGPASPRGQLLAQESTPPAAAPTRPPTTAAPSAPAASAAVPPAAPAPPSPTPARPSLTQAELDQLLAPVALYPDQLLGQILMASTYPVEVVEAARWVHAPAHQALKGDALTTAMRDQNWDPSVMALVPFPRVLDLMSEQIEWTQKLGVAFVAQQGDVMNAVQRLRQQAMAAGNFKSGQQCQCVVEKTGGYVTVAPANPRVVYAPVYDSRAIYGPWLYPAYPPVVFPLPVGFAFAPGFFIGFGVGIDVAYYGPLWGWSSVDWGGHSIIVDPVRYAALPGGHAAFAGHLWAHDRMRAAGLRATAAGVRGAQTGRFGAAGMYRHAAVMGRGGFPGGFRGGFHSGFHGGAGFHGGYVGRGGFHGGFAGRGGFHGGFAGRGGFAHGAVGRPGAGMHAAMAGGPGRGGGGHFHR